MKKLSFIFALLICLAISSFAQKSGLPKFLSPFKTNSECKYGEKDFVGESIDLSLVNADIRDFLSFVTQQYGCDFLVDKSVKEISITVNLHDVPWNVAFDAILESQGLAIECNKSNSGKLSFRVTTVDSFICGFKKIDGCSKKAECPALYTEFIQLKYVPKENKEKYIETIVAFAKHMLSKRGLIEFETDSATLVVIDIREKVNAIKTIEEIVKIFDSNKIDEDKKENP